MSICTETLIVKITPYHAFFFLNAIAFLGFYIKNSSFNRKYIVKITNTITKPQFLTIIKLT